MITITGKNEAIIVELKALFVLNDTFYLVVPIIRLLAITKHDASYIAFNSIIDATSA